MPSSTVTRSISGAGSSGAAVAAAATATRAAESPATAPSGRDGYHPPIRETAPRFATIAAAAPAASWEDAGRGCCSPAHASHRARAPRPASCTALAHASCRRAVGSPRADRDTLAAGSRRNARARRGPRCSTFDPMKRAPCAAAARTVAVTLLPSAERPGSNGATSTPQCTPADTSCSITRSRWDGAGVPGSVRSQISRSTVGTLKQTLTPARRPSSCRTSASRTIKVPLVTIETGVRKRANSSRLRRVSR